MQQSKSNIRLLLNYYYILRRLPWFASWPRDVRVDERRQSGSTVHNQTGSTTTTTMMMLALCEPMRTRPRFKRNSIAVDADYKLGIVERLIETASLVLDTFSVHTPYNIIGTSPLKRRKEKVNHLLSLYVSKIGSCADVTDGLEPGTFLAVGFGAIILTRPFNNKIPRNSHLNGIPALRHLGCYFWDSDRVVYSAEREKERICLREIESGTIRTASCKVAAL